MSEAMKPKPKTNDFSRLFEDLPGFSPPSIALVDLGRNNGPMFDPNADSEDNPNKEPSAFTYFGQFIDHDITLDRTTLVDAPIDIETLTNFREPLLNLDSMYGEGPEGNPEMYIDGRFILSNNGRDLQRTLDGKAVLVESRNDENMVIAQVHTAFCRFHNALMDMGKNFNEAKKLTILHYQWLVFKDFLPRIVSMDIINSVIEGEIELYKPKNPHKLTMPVEFSVAAYRFGHSMVRRAYFMADQVTKIQVFNPNGNDLRGGRPIPADRIIRWDNFVKIPGNPNEPLNISRKIDSLLSSGLFFLPPGAINDGPVELAQRNLIRGKSYGLPSGQAVATELGYQPLNNEEIGLTDPRFNGEAPLWYYILAESKLQTNGAKLGDVGGTIVASVLLGLAKKDKDGIFHGSNKKFQPMTGPQFKFGDLIKIAGLA